MAVWSWCFSEQNLSKFFFVASTQNTACRISGFLGRTPHLGMQENTDGQRQPEIWDMRWKKESRKGKGEEVRPRERKEKDKADSQNTGNTGKAKRTELQPMKINTVLHITI